jgi:hypothetical protein
MMIGQEQAPPAPPILPIRPGLQDADIATLQSQLGTLRIELTGLQAQWRGLKSQLDQMLRTNPARPGVQQQWADVGVQIARAEGDIATIQARIALKEGRSPSGTPGTAARGPWNNPQIAVPVVSVVSLAMLLPLSIGWAKRMSRRGPVTPAPMSSDVANRLERIEQAVDTIAIEVERISEGQRFVTKIMADRPSAAASHAEQPSNQARQPLGLGAGEAPAEPIVIAERERVRK